MKINFVLAGADMSGGVRVVAEFAKELQRRGHDVTVFSTPYPQPPLSKKIKNALRALPQPQPGGRRASHLDQSGVRHNMIESDRPISAADLPDADVVMATWWRTAEWVAALPESKGKKFHLIQHYEVWGGPKDRVDVVWRLPIHRIVVTRWLADLARDQFDDPAAALVPYGLDHEQFNAPPRGKNSVPTVGMLYSSTPFKGCDVALGAVGIVQRTLPNLKLIALSAGDLVAELPLPTNSVFERNPPQDKLKEIYAACDVFLCASHSEGFFLPALEAMACRCPVVSTQVGWPMEAIIDGENGYLANVGDRAALAECLIKVLRLSDADWRIMSESAYTTASRYTWEKATDLLEAAFMSNTKQIMNYEL
jgi:glycosyltransferase involved in cell wall biosynthesis